METLKDRMRLNDILHMIVDQYVDDDSTIGTYLDMSFKAETHPIYRRRILAPISVTGLWWVDDSRWSRWMWSGYKDNFIQGEMLKQTLTTRALNNNGGFVFIRENGGNYVDIEAAVRVARWNPETKKRKGTTSEWLTCSITLDEYKRIDSFLGPIEPGCKHKDLQDDVPQKGRSLLALP